MLRRCWGLVFLACTLYFFIYIFATRSRVLHISTAAMQLRFNIDDLIVYIHSSVSHLSFYPAPLFSLNHFCHFFFFLMYLLTKAPTVDITQGRFNPMSTGPLNCQSSYGYTCCCYKYYRCHDRISCSICANPKLLLGHFLWPLPSTCSCD